MHYEWLLILFIGFSSWLIYRAMNEKWRKEAEERQKGINSAMRASETVFGNNKQPMVKIEPMPEYLLFLDVDGILHPGQRNTLELAHILVGWLKANTHVGVVLSSTWRVGEVIEDVDKLLGSELGPYICGFTELNRGWTREKEVEHFVMAVKPKRYVALDDTKSHFPSNPDWLLHIDGRVGLHESDLKQLSKLFDDK